MIRERVDAISAEVNRGGLTPIRAGELAAELSALLGSIGEEITEADMAFNLVYAQYLDIEKKANRAKIRAELTPEYRRKRQAQNTQLVAVEMMRSLRKLQDTFRDEMRLSR